MKTKPVLDTYKLFLLSLPLIGIGSFIFFYFMAAKYYPGGSWILPDKNGFSFWHNYLCDLLDINAINGEPNKGRTYAITALCLLCLGIFFLWSLLPKLFKTKNNIQKIMSASGYLSLLTILFLALGNHDVIVRIAGVFGVVAFIACCVELNRTNHKKLFLLGLVCIITFLSNYYIYETGIYIKALPVVQKFTFALFISWFIGLDMALYRVVRQSYYIENQNQNQVSR
ncbi:hypothetical protein [uncultured Maribacter sp.]|uniref:hypothetical protein n=1 Tax=uncultured Maribacter sp. TaxID=431308 RepID=UPI0030DC54E2|tara:strand:- start:3317 stop:3997 length:681 start_codon:yes stop_codon:yes gene_type:complete